MLRFALRRLLVMGPLVFLVLTITFIMVQMAPGSPFSSQRRLPPEIEANLKAKYGRILNSGRLRCVCYSERINELLIERPQDLRFGNYEARRNRGMAALCNPTGTRCALIVAACLGTAMAVPSGKELLAALSQGEAATAQRLIKRGAPANAADSVDSSALRYAAIYSDLATMRLLLDKGADPNRGSIRLHGSHVVHSG
jgi:hypothetical protein